MTLCMFCERDYSDVIDGPYEAPRNGWRSVLCRDANGMEAHLVCCRDHWRVLSILMCASVVAPEVSLRRTEDDGA
jgi:hypothetical protein